MALTKIPASLLDTSSGLDLSGNITLGDNERIRIGDGPDLEIYHDGSHSYIDDSGTGNLRIRAGNLQLQRLDGSQNYLAANTGAEVVLYYAGNKKLETSSAGATVTGTLTVTGDLDITGNINSYNVTDLDVTDQTITLGAGQTEANSGGSGIIVDGSGASILWDETNTEWDFNSRINVPSAFSLYYSIRESGTQYGFIGQHKTVSGTGTDTSLSIFSEAGDGINFLVNGSVTKAVVIDSSGRVGIGTSNPGQKLDVTGSTGADYIAAFENTNATNGYGILAKTAHAGTSAYAFAAYSGSNPLMVVRGDGNVGIGTDSPQHKLEVITGSNQTNVVKVGSSASENEKITLGHFNASVTNGLASILTGSKFGGIIQGGENGKLVLGIRDNDVADSVDIVSGGGNYMTDTTFDTLVATFRADGKVGIGTTDPDSLLHLKSTGDSRMTIESPDANDAYINFSGATNEMSLGFDKSDSAMYITNHGTIATNRLVAIKTTGHVGIGTGSNPPEGMLHVVDNTVIFGNSTSGYATVNFHSATSSSARYGSIRKNYDSPYDMRIRASNSGSDVPLIFELSNTLESVKLDTNGLHFQKADGQSITAKESIVMTVDADNNDSGRVFQVNHGNGKQLLLLYDDYRAEVGTLQYNSTRSAGATSASSFTASAGDWVDIATVPYGRNVGTVKIWWDSIYAPSSSHHGLMEFDIGSHYGTSYYYGWDSYINLKTSSAHNSFYISEARIITPGGSGATGYFQVKFGVATNNGTVRAYVTSRDEACTIAPMTPAVNNSRTGTTIASLKMGADRGLTNNRLSLATSRDMHIGGGLTILSQHSFDAYSPAVTTGSNVVVFGNTRHNVGGRYSTSTGRFTAGTSGKYLFTFDVLMRPTNAANYGRILFRVNNVGSNMEQYGDSLTYQADQPNYFALGLTAIISLDIGDFVEVYNAGQWETYGTSYGHFGGHLLG